jgi:SAM-dependent methyltransferase
MVNEIPAYHTDLAYIHDVGFGDFARRSAPGLLTHLPPVEQCTTPVIDLGCGSGIWARALVDAGYRVVGVDLSAAMLELAQQRVPEAEFHQDSFLSFPFPPCQAVTALGEVFNYLFDERNSFESLEQTCRKIHAALMPGGVLIFDVAELDRSKGRTQIFREGPDWTCLVEFERDESRQQLTRRIISFRKLGELYRRQEVIHRQQLYDSQQVRQLLERIGFQVEVVRAYGDYPLFPGLAGFVAGKPEERP